MNTSKSRIYFSPNTSTGVMDGICEILSVESPGDLEKYLGIPTINGRVTKVTFQDVVHKVDKRLASWKLKCLSLAGRATFISSTISAIPVYVIQTAWLPRRICDELDRKMRRFLWGEPPQNEGHI